MKKSRLLKIFAIVLALSILPLTSCKQIHTHEYMPTATNPTCEFQGYTTYACECGVSFVTNYTSELPHSFSSDNICTACGVFNYELAFTHENNVITGLTELGKTLSDFVIPRTINGSTITHIGESAFAFKFNIEGVVIPRTITHIEQDAFKNCINMAYAIIPKTVISVGKYAFRNCDSLTVYYEQNAWPQGWSQLWNYSNRPIVRGYDYATKNGVIYGLKGQTAVVVKQPVNLTTASVVESFEYKNVIRTVTALENYAFYNCLLLESVSLPNTITKIGLSAFEGCSVLESIVIPSAVALIEENAFKDCPVLTIKCRAPQKPNGWHANWNSSSCPVTWNYQEI